MLGKETKFVETKLGLTALQKIENFQDSAPSYNMSHRKRGTAIIFNHEIFDDSTGPLSKRTGTNIDRDSMEITLKR